MGNIFLETVLNKITKPEEKKKINHPCGIIRIMFGVLLVWINFKDLLFFKKLNICGVNNDSRLKESPV